jgi:hypothetical protein
MSADLPPARHLNLWQRARVAVPRMLDTPALRSLVELAMEQAAAERVRTARIDHGEDDDAAVERARRRSEIIQQREQAAMRRRMQGVGLRLPRAMPMPIAWPQERRAAEAPAED